MCSRFHLEGACCFPAQPGTSVCVKLLNLMYSLVLIPISSFEMWGFLKFCFVLFFLKFLSVLEMELCKPSLLFLLDLLELKPVLQC